MASEDDRKAWIEERRGGIGGSDAAAIVGRSPWKTPLEVYLDKIGQGVDEQNEDMRRGALMEPVVRQLYADLTGRPVVRPAEIIRNPKIPFALANLDGIASGDVVLECKTSRDRTGWGEPGTDEIPEVYLFQTQHYLMVTEFERADVAVMFGDFELCVYPVDADAEFQELLRQEEEAFWDLVQKRIPPEPITHNDIKLRWPRNVVPSVAATSRDLEVARVLAEVKRGIATLEEVKERAEAALKASIKDGDGLHVAGETLCTWKNTKPGARFDMARFQAEEPELYAAFVTEALPHRRFLLKGKAKCLGQTNTILPKIPENLLPLETTEG